MADTLKVFISHSSFQNKMATEIAKYVGRNYVHLDLYNFEEGDVVLEEIEANIDKSSIFVLLISSEALESTWVKKELDMITIKLRDEEVADFVPIIVDKSISVEDERLNQKSMKWIKKYITKHVLSPKMAARLIRRKIHRQLLKTDSTFREKEKLFFGRDKDIAELKLKLYEDTSNSKRAVIVSGLDHVGRKRLLMEFILQNINDVHEDYVPIRLLMTESDGIERLISQLNEYLQEYDQYHLIDLLKDYDERINIAVKLLNMIADNQECIIIRDEKCIVLGNGRLTEWFVALLRRKDLHPIIHFFVASKFTPKVRVEHLFPCIISRQIAALDMANMKALFNAYAKNRKLSPNDNETKFFLNHLNGFPKQAYAAVDLLADEGFLTAKKHLSQVTDMFDRNFNEIILELEKIPHAKDILVLFSKFEFVSGDLLALVCPDKIDDALEEFRKYSIYETFGSTNQYLRLNAGIAEYISRNKIGMPPHYTTKLRKVTKELLAEMDSNLTDLSSQLFTIKEMLRDKNIGTKAKERYLLPPFVLKVIVEEYYKREDNNVIQLAEMLLNDKVRNGYDEIIRSIHYWYCCSLCRTRNSKFLKEVEYFNNNNTLYSYYFLKGFYERHLRHSHDAEEYYRKALSQSKQNGDREYIAKAEHELVMVLTELGKYLDAYELAKNSFERDKTNTYHIEAYFRCIANTAHPDGHLMKDLINRMEKSYVKNKTEIVPSMKAQYKYFIEHNFKDAINMLTDIIKDEGQEKRNYARNALKEICSHFDSIQTYHGILRNLGKA